MKIVVKIAAAPEDKETPSGASGGALARDGHRHGRAVGGDANPNSSGRQATLSTVCA
jgi:hypothetical protein